LLVLAAAVCARAAHAATVVTSDSSAASPPALHSPEAQQSKGLFTRSDAYFALAVVGVVAIVAPYDEELADEAGDSHPPGEQDLARAAQPFGNGAYVLPALAAGWLVARASGRHEGASSIVRIGVSVCAAGAGALVLKEIVGRPRPNESSDSDDLYPFSGHASFPSGHAAVSFALATAINRESSWPGTPWVTYPLAAVVGWSRVHDNEHWTSDVVVGAALGIWSANKVEDVLQPRAHGASRAHVGLRWLGGAPAVAVTIGP
jgi:hypothetical protein